MARVTGEILLSDLEREIHEKVISDRHRLKEKNKHQNEYMKKDAFKEAVKRYKATEKGKVAQAKAYRRWKAKKDRIKSLIKKCDNLLGPEWWTTTPKAHGKPGIHRNVRRRV